MGANEKELKPWIKGLKKFPKWSIQIDDMKLSDYTDSCVILSDYSRQLSQTVLPRQILNEGIIDVEADCIPFMRTALLNGTGVQGMRVNNGDEAQAVDIASTSINQAALSGRKYVPIIGSIDFQSLTDGQVAKAEEYLMAMQSLDNFRLGTIGVENGGLFQKKAHELQSEANLNMGGGIGAIMQDSLTNRQNFCDIVNSIWGLGIDCQVSETQGVERDGDGIAMDSFDESGVPGEQEVNDYDTM